MKEVWKRRFFILLGLVVLCIGGSIFLLTRPLNKEFIENEVSSPADESELATMELQLSEKEVKELILQAIEKQGYELRLNLSPQFQLYMPVKLAGQTVDLFLEGQAQEGTNGNIEIHIEKVMAGRLTLQKQLALNILELALPDEFPLHTYGQNLEIDLNKLNKESPIKLRAKTFRPSEQDYQFEIKFPKKMIFEGMEEAL